MPLEDRPYGPDATPGELAELRARVWKVEDRLFMYKEITIQTPFTIDLFFGRLEELAEGLDPFAYVVDLSGVRRPDAKVRAELRDRATRIRPRVVTSALVLQGNPVLRAVAKIVAFGMGFSSVSFHESVEEAVEACRRALR